MPNFTSFPSIDFSDLDLSRITPNLSKLSGDLSKLTSQLASQVTSFEMPKFEMPKFDLPKVDLPDVDLPKIVVDTDRIAEGAREAAYAGIGLTVLAVQQAQVRRRELQAAVGRQVRQARETLDTITTR